nr:hypothetical protein [Tanacetum cinerariifolium]
MHKAFPLLVRKFPLPEGTSHCLKKNATTRRKVMPLPEDCTAVIVKKKLSVKDDGFLKISAPCPALYSSSNRKCNIVYKDSFYYKRSLLVRDRKQFLASPCIHSFKIYKDTIPHYLCCFSFYHTSEITQDSYVVPANDTSTPTSSTTSGETSTKSRRTVTLTIEDMQRKTNDVKARTTLLLSLPDEHQLRFRAGGIYPGTIPLDRVKVLGGSPLQPPSTKYQIVGNKMHKAFPLLVRKFPLPKGTSHCLKKNATARRKVMPLLEDCTAIIVKKKMSVKDDGFLKISAPCPALYSSSNHMDQQYPTVDKIPMLDTGKFEQWQFWMQQYLQYEHYALWEVIEFGDSYVVPTNDSSTPTLSTTSGEMGTKSGRTVTLTTEDMQRKKNDVKARTTLLLSLPDEHQLRFIWRKRSDLNTMSLDDLYNHLKVYESEVQKKSKPNTQNMAFISSVKHSRGNDEVNTANVYTASNNVSTASANVSTVSISQETGSKAEEQASKALMAIDEVGWDWSYMANDEEDHALVADEEPPTKFALMANTSTESKVFDNSLCSKDCKKNNDSLNSKITDLTEKLFDANNMIYHYKLALAQVESRLVEYKEKEVKYIEKIRILEYYNEGKKECIESLRKELETLKQEKEVVDGKLAGLLLASKDLDNLIESQRSDKSKEGLGYTAVPPPVAQLYLSPKKDLS